jgi:diguanylate cyclase (GGDEF)-like protein
MSKFTADQARTWVGYLAAGTPDLDQIATGQAPTAASSAFLQQLQKTSQVFRYKILDGQGHVRLVADHDTFELVSRTPEVDPQGAAVARSGQVQVSNEQGASPGVPLYFGSAYVPVYAPGRLVAVIGVEIDTTKTRADILATLAIIIFGIVVLIGVSFGIPAVAWYRSTKKGQKAARRIHFLAHHDPLTGLANRRELKSRMDLALGASGPGGSGLAVHFMDIDHFKAVNDSMGHDAGDFLLQTLAERLRGVARPSDVVARLGGDEFVVIQGNVRNPAQAEEFASRILAALSQPVAFQHELVAAVSIGIALAPADGQTAERLLKCADLALYQSKSEGRGCVRFFTAEMDENLKARVELERAIRDALLHDGFELNYQPLFEMKDRRLIGFEALVRLRRADGTFIPPMTFIPVAEELRVIDKIGRWVLREACLFAATWPNHLSVAVNLSPAQFSSGSVSAVVAEALAESNLESHRLELEVTETLLLRDVDAVLIELQKLKALGVTIAMDDFGTGYSSLAYLWRFPFDKIKIDQSFIQGLGASSHDSETVVRTIIALGRELKMRVTVEGVETARQAAFLDAANGDQVQGFYFGRPVPAAEVAAEILAHRQTIGEPTPAKQRI